MSAVRRFIAQPPFLGGLAAVAAVVGLTLFAAYHHHQGTYQPAAVTARETTAGPSSATAAATPSASNGASGKSGKSAATATTAAGPPAGTSPTSVGTSVNTAAGAAGATTSAPGPSAPARASAVTYPGIGIAAGSDLQNWSLADLNRQFDDYNRLHASWIRHDFSWDTIEPQAGIYSWSGYDQLVSAARAHNLNVIAMVSYTPAWANGGHSDHNYQPASAQQFGSFAGTVAARYAQQGVHVYEVWNEPNIQYWQPLPDPAAYTQVLCSAYSAIHAADPQATVITGGSSPASDTASTISPQTWLRDLYQDSARNCFDAVGHHPYIDSTSTPGDLGGQWYEMEEHYQYTGLRDIMIANGDSAKRVWATEVGCNRAALGDSECSTRIQKAFQLWKSYSWAGALTWFMYWDPNDYGLVDGNWNPRPEWYAYQTGAGAF